MIIQPYVNGIRFRVNSARGSTCVCRITINSKAADNPISAFYVDDIYVYSIQLIQTKFKDLVNHRDWKGFNYSTELYCL